MKKKLNVERAQQYATRRLEKELSPGFYYHNVRHTVKDIVPAAKRFARGEGVRGEDLDLLLTAAWFHDLGFVEIRAGHEALGARIAGEVLPRFGYNDAQIRVVQETIMATLLPQSPVTLLGQILADADLDVLGRDDFMLRNNNLRRELAFFGQEFSDEQWFSGQLKFVESHVYFTATARRIRDAGQEKSIADLKKKFAEVQQDSNNRKAVSKRRSRTKKPRAVTSSREKKEKLVARTGNAENLKDALARANTQSRQLASLNLVAQAVSSTRDLNEILEITAREIVSQLEARSCGVALMNPAGTQLEVVAFSGQEGEASTVGVVIPIEGNLGTQQVVETRRSLVLTDAQNSPLQNEAAREIFKARGTTCLLITPLINRGEVIGTFGTDTDNTNRVFTADEVELAATVASQISGAIENARLYTEIHKRFKETEILRAANVALTKSFDLDAILGALLDYLQQVVPYDSGSVFLLEGETRLTAYAARGYENWVEDPTQAVGISFEFKESPHIRAIVEHQTTVVIPDVTQNANWIVAPSSKHVRNWLAIPLVAGGKTIGMYSLDKVEVDFFTPEHQRLAENLASQAAIAIQNATLFRNQQAERERAETQTRQMATLNRVAQAIMSTLDLQGVLEVAAREMGNLLNARSVGVGLLNDKQTELRIVSYASKNDEPSSVGLLIPVEGNVATEQVIETGQSILIPDAQNSPLQNEATRAIMRERNTHCILIVPVLARGKVIGTFGADTDDADRVFTAEEMELAQTIASQISGAIENARLFDETQRLLNITEDRAQELAIINSVQEGLASKLEIQAIYDLIGDKIRDIFDAQGVAINVYDHSTNYIHTPYYLFRGVRVTEPGFELGRGLTSHLIQTAQPLVINENAVNRYEELGAIFVESENEDSAKSWLGIPLIIGDQVTGAIQLENYEHEHAFSDSDVHLLTTLANAMSVALENARLFDETQRLLKVTEERAQELEAISKVSQALVVESELDSTIQLIGNQMREIFNADIVYLALLDFQTNLIHFPYQYGESFEPLVFGEGLTSKIIQTGKPLLINQNLDERRAEIGATRVGREALSYLGVPIKTGKGAIGVISVQSTTQEGIFTDDSLRLLTTIAANAGAALHNAQLFSEALENLRQVEILTNAANAIEQSAYEPAMVETVAARTDALGELARVFAKMADEVRIREQRLKRQLAQMQLDIEEKKLAKAETVAIYISMDRRHAMAQHVPLPERAHGTALFADVSGFTTLTESLANELGLRRGAEEMIRHLNRVFTVLIDEVHRYSGAVISFSGDAITCWFDDLDLRGNPRADSSLERAAACAFAMQKGMMQFAAIFTPNGKTIGLSIKVALAVGPTRRMAVGDGNTHQIDVLAGATLSALADAEHETERGEVVLAASNLSVVEEKFNVSAWRAEKQFAVLTGLKNEVAPSPWTELGNNAIPKLRLRSWMHPIVFEKVRAGQSDMLSELRPATALFMKFGGLDYDHDPEVDKKLNAFIKWVEGVIAPHNGWIIQFTVGDKGSYIYIVFGAPIAHRDDGAQAVFTALELASPPESLSYMTDLFIGLASGQMRVGAYGGAGHRTYGAIGDSTNLAARLMMAASRSSADITKGQRAIILCDEFVYNATKAQVEFESMPRINVKGKTEAIAIYRPLRKLNEDEIHAENISVPTHLIDDLPATEQLTLKVASVIGQTFTFEALSAIYPEKLTDGALQKHLQTLSNLGFIDKRPNQASSYSFKDQQTHEAAYNLMLFAQRRQLHRAVAELLEQTVFSVPPYAEIAHHWQAANEIPKAIEYLEKAGEHARQMGNLDAATRFFNESLALGS